MPIHDDAIQILRVLYQNNNVIGYEIRNATLMEKSDLDEEAYDKAENYLLETGFIEGSSGGPTSLRCITSTGINYLLEILSQRLPLSIDAERILNYLTKSGPVNSKTFERSTIITNLKLDDSRFDSAVQILVDFKLVQKGGRVAFISGSGSKTDRSEENLTATEAGRQAVHRGFRDPNFASQTSQIFNINAPANVQAVSNAIITQIEQQVTQTISNNDPEVIRATISELLNSLVDMVSKDITLKERADYIEAAAGIEEELNKGKPEINNIQRWLARLAFLDQVISVSDKALTLSVKVLPTIMMLIKIAESITGN